jgi:hypothetical protein
LKAELQHYAQIQLYTLQLSILNLS